MHVLFTLMRLVRVIYAEHASLGHWAERTYPISVYAGVVSCRRGDEWGSLGTTPRHQTTTWTRLTTVLKSTQQRELLAWLLSKRLINNCFIILTYIKPLLFWRLDSDDCVVSFSIHQSHRKTRILLCIICSCSPCVGKKKFLDTSPLPRPWHVELMFCLHISELSTWLDTFISSC